MEPVRELDHEHADVLGHGDDHLADGLRLGTVAVFEFVELGHPVDEHGNFVTELVAQMVEGVLGVLHRVVQQRGGHGLRADAEIGEDLRHGDRVGDVRLAALALLPGVSPFGRVIGALDDRRDRVFG